MSRGPAQAWRDAVAWFATVGFRWRSSLQARVITATLVAGLVAVGATGAYLVTEIRDGLFDQRVTQLLAETARSAAQAQATLDASTASTVADVQPLFITLVAAQQVGGSGEREVYLRRSPSEGPPVFVNDMSTDPSLGALIAPELREAVRGSDVQRWVSVAIPRADGGVDPGVVIGSAVTVPVVGRYELYYLYSLAGEQQTLTLVQRVLAIAAVGLMAFIGGITLFVTRQAVRPVRAAARVAERLADGRLEERMAVRGVDELATLGRSFNEMAESLQDQILRMAELSDLQRRFVSDVSHELRTPLTTVRMAAEVIGDAKGSLDPAAARSVELLTSQLDRFEDLLADLLEISRFDAGAVELDAESRDIGAVVARVVDGVAPLAVRRGVPVTTDLGRPVVADIDPRRVERILRNLLNNAIEHAEGRPIVVRVGADVRAVAVTVRDHGVGMPAEATEHVFDRFWRADPARARTTGGTGLGLAISLEDARLHDGWLEAWSRPGEGACFRLTLPLRAGIELTGSPLPLVPEDEGDARAASAPVSAGSAALDPAAVPDLSDLEYS